METAFQICAARVREADRDRYLATLFAPERYRGPLFALYAFASEIAHVRDRVTSPLPGEVRLQWWRDLLASSEPGDAAGNPIAAGLLDTVRRFALSVPALVDLIDAHSFDLYDEPMATLVALEDYADRTSATVIRLAAHILNEGVEPGQGAAARHAGIATAMTKLLQRLPLHSARGQRFLPDDVMGRHGAVPAELQAGRATDEIRQTLAELRQVARNHLAALRETEIAVPLRLLPAFLKVSLLPSVLERMDRMGADPFRPSVVPQWRRQWILWRAARDPARFIAARLE